MTMIRKYQFVFVIFIAFVFIQSLFFKFTDSPETQYIFGTLDAWAGTLGFAGVFAPGGIFSQYVIGSFELIASVALLASLVPTLRGIRPWAALLALGVISGAIFFHLFTPLGVSVLNADGGELFGLACGVWVSAAVLIVLNRDRLPIIGHAVAA